MSLKISDINNRISNLPTIMDISDELQIIDELMQIESDELIENKDIFCTIVKEVEISHADSGFMELTVNNEGVLIQFYHWLNKVNVELKLGLNSNTLETFSLTADEVKRLMPPRGYN